MERESLKELVVHRLLPRVRTPGQYIGGELNAVVKDPRRVRGRLCLAFPDSYSIGMSHHGLQVLYAVMNRREDWACERVFAPWTDMEQLLRQNHLPLFSLETFTPLARFDILGFTLQYELCYSNVLTILDLAGIPLSAHERTLDHPLVIAGGPCAQNPEPMSRFVDLLVIGDGEETLPQVCDEWLRLKHSGGDRTSLLAEMAAGLPSVYVPQCYEPEHGHDGEVTSLRPTHENLPEVIQPAVVADLDAVPLPTAPVVPYVECVQDRIAIEIMRGCPWRCRFCQSSSIKRPVRFRRVETIVRAALESYRNTGYNEVSLLSLSTSDYPDFEELMLRLRETFAPLGVSLSVPSLRVGEQLLRVSELLETDRRSGLTLAPEAARDDMRRQIGKRITNADLIEGCRKAFQKGFRRVKLYFMCGLPGERPVDLDGIIDLAETISRLGREVAGRPATVIANVSNFVPKPHTPYQWNAMQTREYFRQAREHLFARRRLRSVELKCHDIEASLLEGVLCRGDRRTGAAIELAWRRGARFDGWSEHYRPELWWEALAESGIDVEATLHRRRPIDARLPWDHVGTRQGRSSLEREQGRSVEQLAARECSGE
ncbi:MAG: B12-binding domain-containing radical SAM protein [Planctomycetes bacterium RBG_16_64_12]|nr:MAG: B12-binding domain-containing radical SAM protein [Planctomycetes bacterium RBG_16_64_12]